MTLRHAAALTLMGWYLMVTPAPGTKPVPPLYKWVRLYKFDSASQCEQGVEEYEHPLKAGPYLGCLTANGAACPPSATQPEEPPPAKCIATDDPRLKEK
jgi:hypothetical protein